MKRLAILGLVVFMWGCAGVQFQAEFAPQSVIEAIDQHTVAIAVYYAMTLDEYTRRQNNKLFRGQLVMPLISNGKIVYVAYIGAGTIVKDNYIITVKHLFDHAENTLGQATYVFKRSLNHYVEADVVAISEGKEFNDDYAVIRLREDLGMPGLKIAKADSLKMGDKVIYSGSVGGMAWFTRFGRVTQFSHFFRRDESGKLHLSFYEKFPYWCVYPSGPGDSGGSVTNIYGEIVTIMYCGVNVYEEQYVFGNPTALLWDFLNKHDLGWLGQ